MATGLPARRVIVCVVLVAAGLIVAASNPAFAERRPVAVVDLSATTPAEALATELYKVLRNHVDLLPLDNPDFIKALKGPFYDEEAPYLERARRAKLDAEEALAQLDDANAARHALRGMQELTHVLPDRPEVIGLYAELTFALGQAQLGLRKPNDASLAFQLVHRLDPARRPDPTRYQPNIVEAYHAAANRPSVPAKLTVKGEGRVWIDGVEVGPPGTYDATEGLHLVQMAGPERETRGEQVLVPQVTETEIAPAPATDELKIQRARIALAKAPDPTARVKAMRQLAKLLGVADAVLILKGEGDTLLVQTWRDPKQGFSAVVRHRDEQPIDLLSPLAPPRKEKEPDPFVVIPPIVEEPRWYQKTWVRASIAGGVVLGIVTAILLTRGDQMLELDPDGTWVSQ